MFLKSFSKILRFCISCGLRFTSCSNRIQCRQRLATAATSFRAVLSRRWAAKMDPAIRYMLRRPRCRASIMKIWFPTIFEICLLLKISDSVCSAEDTSSPLANDLRLLCFRIILGGSEVHWFSVRSAMCLFLSYHSLHASAYYREYNEDLALNFKPLL